MNETASELPCLDDALLLLRLQIEWGADEAIDIDPVDRLQPAVALGQPRLGESTPILVPPLIITPGALTAKATLTSQGTPADQAAALAARAVTLEQLRDAVASFDRCALRDTASNLVFAEGDPSSTTLIIGEPPGREEDRSGHPFAGPEGQLLDQMLASIGLSRSTLMLAPLLPWRPPGGRPPSAAEIALCQPFLHRLIVLLKPRRIVLFGGTVARVMLPQGQNRRRTPRAWTESSITGVEGEFSMLALPGLADMLKNPSLRRDAWTGLRLLRRTLALQ